MYAGNKMLATVVLLLTYNAVVLCHDAASAEDLTTREVNRVDEDQETVVGARASFENRQDLQNVTAQPTTTNSSTPKHKAELRQHALRTTEEVELRREYEIDANSGSLNDYSALQGGDPIFLKGQEGSRRRISSHTGCHYVFSVPSGPQCSPSAVDAKVAELRFAFDSFETKLDQQRSRLEAAELFVTRINSALHKNGFFSGSGQVSGEVPPLAATPRADSDGAAKALLDLADATYVQMLRLQIRVERAEKERAELLKRNSNLTELLQNAFSDLEDLNQVNRVLLDSTNQRNRERQRLLAENRELRSQRDQLRSEKSNVERSKELLLNRVNDLNNENQKLRRNLEFQSEEMHKVLKDKAITEKLLANATSRISELENVLAATTVKNITGSGGSSATGPCNALPNSAENGSERDSADDFSRCGKLVSVSEPETIRASTDAELYKYGIWMKDPLAKPDNDKVWTIQVIRSRILNMREFANMSDFSRGNNSILRRLETPLESTGAVVFNGSLYYQRRNSRRIVRYDIQTQRTLRERPIRQADFHGKVPYHWGGNSDMDFAVDETGLWLIYSAESNKGNIIVAKIHPVSLKQLVVIKTKIPKRSVANAFIICQTLYTVGSNKARQGAINYSVHLRTRKVKKLNIPFMNKYRFNVMVDYNPRDRYLYSWDNAHQVRYKVKIDTTYGRIRKRRMYPRRRRRT